MKALGLVVSDKKIFESCIFKTYFLPCDLLSNQSEPFEQFSNTWNILINIQR